ncbi:MAG: cell division protein ZapE [Ostreibacterium sp.]
MTKNDWQKIYQERITQAGYSPDRAQLAIIEDFSSIENSLSLSSGSSIKKSLRVFFFSRLLAKKEIQSPSVKGLYLFGSVGRGKTFLMDLLCEYIPYSVKRLHFQHFMKEIHNALTHIKNQQNPLEIIAKDFAKQYRILCLDEFMVNDITDAMLLYGLLKSLIDNGVVIITTTNIPPDDLYKNGLQRERFLPAIALIKDKLVVHHIENGQDFRRACLAPQHPRFFHPLNEQSHEALVQITIELSEHLSLEKEDVININDRDITFIAKSAKVIWFSFDSLCEGYRSPLDYIELAKQFNVFIVSDIPVLDVFKEDAAKRFLLLVDELYDRRVDLILSSEVPIEAIYTGKKIAFEFERLQSRLFEMQNVNYGNGH